ncbi:AAA family ATPase [Streptococcus panodentis]|uniref:ATP-dependent Clp protease ATP-binding subunit n=1 Tax=Streptococcus panodentis TaxID=1581472 RepID=A0ABS5AV67_9STRE|nr:ATP-dependent Clp protease ATP-binding subunit [Streptococcus panodentis]MBP2620468.1 ATP-dependent Clp protease ATP-binding subunit [Streptococcus panodentis]
MIKTEELQQREEYREAAEGANLLEADSPLQDLLPQRPQEEESPTPYLDKYTENVTEKIRKKIDHFTVFGREKEVEQVIVSLLRQTKNSPILVGEAGTGKTAIVDGLVVEILKGNVPDEFKHVTVRSLELSSISSKSDGEDMVSRLKRIIEELKATKGENILFIDEVHTIVGAGGDGSMLDAGNVIKPPLARGEIQMISATTYEEYQSSIETDKALERRVQMVPVEEPTADQAIFILGNIRKRFEKERHITITDDAVEQAVRLAVRYIPERFLPDKAIDLLDDATAQAYFEKRKVVDIEDIARVIQKMKKIPVTTILKDDSERLMNFTDELKKYVKGQDFAVSQVANTIYISKEGFQRPNKPLGSFLFLGTTGVGKTELAKALAKILFDNVEAMIRIDCSEYSSKGDKDKLIGKNIVGSKGLLTEPVKNNPYSVVLLDELEKAHPDIYDILLQVLDEGHLTTGTGRKINFKNTIVIATTNSGADEIKKTYANEGNFGDMTDLAYDGFMNRIVEELSLTFRPEFINRFGNKVVFNMLTTDIIEAIVDLAWTKEEKRLAEQKVYLQYEDKTEFYDFLRSKGTSVENGARPLERLIQDRVTGPIAEKLFLLQRHGAAYNVLVKVIGEAPDGIFHHIDKRTLDFEATKIE